MTDRPIPTSDPVAAAEAIHEAETLLARGERAAAADALERVLATDPFNDEAPLMAAMIRFEERELPRAVELALQALRIRPFHPSAMNLLGVACLDAGYPVEARKLLGRAVAAAPGLGGAKRNLRQARRHTGTGPADAGFPVDAVRAALGAERRGLTVCVVVSEGSDAPDATLESVSGLDAELLAVDATPGDGVSVIPSQESIHRIRLLPTPDRASVFNAAIRRATGDWILVLEPGETLHADSMSAVSAAVVGRGSLFHEAEIRDTHGEARWLEPRLFRNAPGMRYVGSVHPTLRPCLHALATQWRLAPKRPGIVIESPRIRAYAAEDPGRDGLAEAMARHELEQNPGDVSLVVQQARVQLEGGDPEAALATLGALEASGDVPGFAAEELATLHGRCLVRVERYPEARERIESHHRRGRATRNTLLLEGLAAGATGGSARAVRLLSRCLRGPNERGFIPPFQEITGAVLPNVLGALMLDLERLDDAREMFELALEREPASLESRMGLLGLQLAAGEIEPMLQELDRWISDQGDDPRVWSFGATLLGRIPRLGPAAASWMDEACRRFPDHDDLRRQRAEVRLRGGYVEAAGELLTEAPREGTAGLAARVVAALMADAELPAVPLEAHEAVEREVLGWLRQWMDGSAYEALDRALVELGRTRTRLPGLAKRTAGWLEEIDQAEAAARIRQGLTEPTSVGS